MSRGSMRRSRRSKRSRSSRSTQQPDWPEQEVAEVAEEAEVAEVAENYRAQSHRSPRAEPLPSTCRTSTRVSRVSVSIVRPRIIKCSAVAPGT